MVLKNIKPISMAKILGILYVFIGLLVGLIFAFLSVLGVAFSEHEFGTLLGLIFGVGSIIFMPIFYGSLGFFFGLIGAHAKMFSDRLLTRDRGLYRNFFRDIIIC